jgi:hypothetical protein
MEGSMSKSATVTTRLAGALVVLLAVAGTQPASAEVMDRDAFKKGCTDAGNSYVENASDDSYGCNIKTGGSIKCKDVNNNTTCTYTEKLVGPDGSGRPPRGKAGIADLLRDPGLLADGQGFPPRVPAATGKPSAPPAGKLY